MIANELKEIKFSIGIPAFKAKFLAECISSVLGQSYENFELIIVDDCSPDDLQTIISTFKDSRIRSFRNDINVGSENVVHNWNKCLNYSTGDFFVLMGDDDKLEQDFLYEFASLIAKYPSLDVYHCRTKIIDEESNSIRLTPSCPEYETVYDNMWHRVNGLRVQFISDFLYRTQPLKERGGYHFLPLAWASDDLSAYIACGDKGIAHTNKPVFNYRMNRYNISSTGNRELKMKAILMQSDWFHSFLNKVPLDSNDLIIYNDLRGSVKKYIQKKKILTISRSFGKNTAKSFIKWFKVKNEYGVSFPELMYAVFDNIKTRKAKSNYQNEE